MKHRSTTIANGLPTPPCSHSHSKSTRFSLLTSFLLFFLLFVGSNAAWAGWRFQGQNGSDENWSRSDNMTQVGSSDIWYYKISNLNADIQFKINNGDWGGNNQKYWSANHDDQNRGNVQLEDANDGDSEGKNRFKYSRSTNFNSNVARDLYIFVKGDANSPSVNDRVWAVATPVGENELSNLTFKMRGDLFINNSYSWLDTDNSCVPSFEKLIGNRVARIQLLVPQPKNSETIQIRLEIKNSNGSTITPTADSDGSNGVSISTSSTKTLISISGTGNANTSVKLLTICYYASNKVSATLSDCTTDDSWYVYVDKSNRGQLSNGRLDLNDLSSGDHSIFLAKNAVAGSDITPVGQGWSHCIQWLGGLHINKNASDVAWATQYQYSNETRFSASSVTWPIKGQFDGRGQFHLNATSNVRVKLTNGVISLDILDGTEPEEVTYTSQSYMFVNNSQNQAGLVYGDLMEGSGTRVRLAVKNEMTGVEGYSDAAKYWDKVDNKYILILKMPAGQWTHCRLFRRGDDNNNYSDAWNKTDWIALDATKNYLNTTGWDSYTPRFYVPSASGAISGGNDWTWNGDGTLYSGTCVKTLNEGEYKFKITIPYRLDGGNRTGWDNQLELNYYNCNESLSNVDLEDGDNGGGQIRFTLPGTKVVTIQVSENGVTVNAEDPAVTTHTVTFNSNGGSSVANQEVEDGEKAIQPANPTKSGYTFNYWKLSGESTEFDFNTTITGNITLVADWSAVPAVNYNGGEIFYFHKKGGSLQWGSVYAGNAAVFLEFSNADESSTARSTKIAYFWDTDNTNGDILATRVPVGTWNKVRVKRYGWNTGNQTLGGDYNNNSDWVTLESGKNYLNGSNTMDVYSNPRTFHFYISGSTALANTGSEFNAWNGNGTAHSGSITKTLNAGNEYKFRLNPTGTQDWRSEFNWNDIDAANSSNNINLRKNPANNNTEIWFDLSRKSDVTIACNGSKVTVNATPYYNVTFNSDGGSDVDAQSILSGGTVIEPSDPTRGSGYTFNFWKLSGESSAYDFSTPVTSDIELVADWTAPTLYTVTFDSNGGSEVDAQEVVENETATEPAAPTRDNYTFAGWKLGNALYNFSTPVTGNITLVADWTYAPAHISSVSINESSIYTWAGDATTYTLVPTLVPADIASVTVSWSSSDNNVATVVNGVITPQRAGTATITCIATDYYSGSQTATCAVKVAPCAKELAGAPSYNVTITGYNSYEDGDATLTGLWNESSDNTEPAELEKIRIQYPNGNGNDSRPVAVDADHRVIAQSNLTDTSDYWYRIPAGENIQNNDNGGHDYAVYYLKNVKTGEYMYVDKSVEYGQNGDYWHYFATRTSAEMTNENKNIYKWFTAVNYGQGDHRNVIVNKDGFNGTYTGDGARSNIGLYRTEVNPSNTWQDPYIKTGQKIMNGYQNAHTGMVPTISSENITNPAYIQSQMNSSYYRMKENATVQANLGSALAEADVISVELYADAATSVTLCKTNGDVVATINLNADAATEYTYLVTAGTMLDGENAFIIKAADNHAGIRSIVVTPMVTADPAQPDLHWTTTPVKAHLLLDGNFTYTAASNDSQGAISYASEDTDVAQVDASTGEVTPSGAGTTNIIATITADECYTTYSISYEVSFLGLQDYIATDGVNSVTLPGDYTSENIVINKPFTINGAGHSIGNLTVETAGDLTLSGALTVNDFSIYAKAGNTTTPAASGQVRNATNLTVNGEAYFLYTVDPSGHVQYGWYDFTVPFRVNVMTGIKGIQDEVLNEDFVNERDYAVMEHLGEKQAAGEYAYKKFRGVMEPCRLYSITLDPQNNYNTIRFQKADGDLVAGNSVALNSYDAVEDKHANWNGVGNGTLHHADAGVSVATIQVYQSGNKTFLAVDRSQYSLVIGSAFMVQETGTMTLNQATHSPLLAPKRAASVQPTAIQIASEGQPFSDQLFISADEMAGQGYTQGVDVAKAGNIGNVNVPQIWTNAYDSKLCAHEAQLINGEAQYTLSLYAPANGTYTLTGMNIPEDYTLYLTKDGNKIWNMSDTYTFDLNKGTTTGYGLLLVDNSHHVPTGIENGEWTNGEGRKVLHNGILYILHNGKVFNAQGAVMK